MSRRRTYPHQLLSTRTPVIDQNNQAMNVPEPMLMILEQLKKNAELLTSVMTHITERESEIASIKEKVLAIESSCYTGKKNKCGKQSKEISITVSISYYISMFLIYHFTTTARDKTSI